MWGVYASVSLLVQPVATRFLPSDLEFHSMPLSSPKTYDQPVLKFICDWGRKDGIWCNNMEQLLGNFSHMCQAAAARLYRFGDPCFCCGCCESVSAPNQ